MRRFAYHASQNGYGAAGGYWCVRWRLSRHRVGGGRADPSDRAGATTAEAHAAVKDVKKGFWEEIGKWAAAGVTGFAAVAFAWLYGHSGQGWATLKVLWMFVRSLIGL